MEERRMNGLVPPDQLHWSDDLKCYTIISPKETDDLIEACFRTGIKDAKQILNVVKEYEKVRSGQLLFGQFLAGNIGIYEFDEDGSPVFESIRKESIREITFDSRVEAENENAESVYGRSVTCSTAGGESIAFYRAVVDFCSKWGIDILAGENPEEEAITREDPDFIADMRRRSWRVVEVENAGPSTRIRVMFTGDWLRTDHAS
jgi:hypothetical protein